MLIYLDPAKLRNGFSFALYSLLILFILFFYSKNKSVECFQLKMIIYYFRDFVCSNISYVFEINDLR